MHVDEVAAWPTEQSACRWHYFLGCLPICLCTGTCARVPCAWQKHLESTRPIPPRLERRNENKRGPYRWTSLDPLSWAPDSEHHFCSLPQLSSRWVWPLKCLPHAADSPRMLRRWLSPTQTTANREHHTTRTITDALLHDYFDSASPSARTGQVHYGV